MEIEQLSVLDASDPLSKAVNEISRTGLPVLVMKNKKYIGMIDERSIRQHPASPDKAKCENAAERTPVLPLKTDVLEACKAFFLGRFKAIPVADGKKIVGAITRHTLLHELLQQKALPKKRVSDIMTKPVFSIDISSTIGKARSELRKHNVRRLVVTKDGKIAGMISVFDLANYSAIPRLSSPFELGGEKESLDSQPVSAYMKKQVETIQETETLSSAVEKMLERKVAALVVSDKGYPIGIVTAKDILRAVIVEQEESRVFVSGLPYEQRDYASEFISEGKRLLSKLGKSMEVHSLSFHVKKEGSGFSIRAILHAKEAMNASAFDYKIENALHHVISEMRRMAEKSKTIKAKERMHFSEMD